MSERAPAVSIVVATYNRSNVLRFALESARTQTFEDWEMWVIGDACTDDTEEVVRSFGDSRARFFNLAQNVGEQTGPNNEGLRRARGRHVAFLNHDDLWLPEHLAGLVAELERGDTDVAFAIMAHLLPDGSVLLRPSWTGGYAPNRMTAPASSWLMRREAFARVGGWRHSRECFHPPSQDWLQRAQRAGVRIRQPRQVSLLGVQSGLRPGSYARRDDAEHRELWARMAEPGFRERLLEGVAVEASAEVIRPRPIGANLRRVVTDAVVRRAGLQAQTLWYARNFGRRGGFIEDLRRVRGLPTR